MAIKMVPDLGAPIAVVGVDLITETAAPDWNEWAAYLMAAGGYVGAFMGWGGDFVKNVGIASFPWAAKKVYQRVKGGAVGSRLSYKRAAGVSRWPAPAAKTPFEGIRIT